MTEIRMPKPGEAIEEGILSEILVPDGGSVSEGQELFAVETDKVEMVLDSPATGTVRWHAQVGETYAVGTLLAVIE